MKKLKIIALLSLVVVTSIMFVGCGGSGVGELGAEVASQIKQDYYDKGLGNLGVNEIGLEYYGTYNGAVAVMVFGSNAVGDAVWECTVDGIKFSYRNYVPLIVWKDGEFYTLQEAYGNDFLTKDNLKSIQKHLERNK